MPSSADVPALLVGLEVIWVESSSCSTAGVPARLVGFGTVGSGHVTS